MYLDEVDKKIIARFSKRLEKDEAPIRWGVDYNEKFCRSSAQVFLSALSAVLVTAAAAGALYLLSPFLFNCGMMITAFGFVLVLFAAGLIIFKLTRFFAGKFGRTELERKGYWLITDKGIYTARNSLRLSDVNYFNIFVGKSSLSRIDHIVIRDMNGTMDIGVSKSESEAIFQCIAKQTVNSRKGQQHNGNFK